MWVYSAPHNCTLTQNFDLYYSQFTRNDTAPDDIRTIQHIHSNVWMLSLTQWYQNVITNDSQFQLFVSSTVSMCTWLLGVLFIYAKLKRTKMRIRCTFTGKILLFTGEIRCTFWKLYTTTTKKWLHCKLEWIYMYTLFTMKLYAEKP